MTDEPNRHLQCTCFSLKTGRRDQMGTIHQTGKEQACQGHSCPIQDRMQVCIKRRRRMDYIIYDQRRCPSCPDCIQDETHAIFHCRTCLFQGMCYDTLFHSHHSLRSSLTGNQQHATAAFMTECLYAQLYGQADVDVHSEAASFHDVYDSS